MVGDGVGFPVGDPGDNDVDVVGVVGDGVVGDVVGL